jgi:hypothetical protein
MAYHFSAKTTGLSNDLQHRRFGKIDAQIGWAR